MKSDVLKIDTKINYVAKGVTYSSVDVLYAELSRFLSS